MVQPDLFLPGDTYRVSVLADEIQAVLQQAYRSIWVAGELQRLRPSAAGHVYFELVEKGEGDRIVGRLDAVIWRSDYRRISRALGDCDQVLAEGQEIRCRGNLDFYPAGGRLQVVVREVDPVFTLGLLARRRQVVVAELRRSGLFDRNKSLALAEIPLRIGLVTSAESAAYHDFLSSLRDSGYGFQVSVASASVQGPRAAVEVSRALRSLWRRGSLDCLALVRGGGSRSDLAAFDSEEVAEAVCTSALPVLTGLGHEIDQAVADLVAHRAFKTPTSTAEFLVLRVAEAEQRLKTARSALSRSAGKPIERGWRSLTDAQRGLRGAGVGVARLSDRLDSFRRRAIAAGRVGVADARRRLLRAGSRLAPIGPLRIERARYAASLVSRRLVDLSMSRNRETRARIAALDRLLRELSPQRTLQRGFTITRDAGGRAIRSAAEVEVNQAVTTQLAEGTLTSRIVDRVE